MNRKNFLKKACLSGMCFCGFSSLAGSTSNDNDVAPNPNLILQKEWLSNLLSNLNQDLDKEVLKHVVKKSAVIHYNNLNMDAVLSDYIGDLDKFNNFLETAWAWKIDYNKESKVLLADENKNYCVCPILEHKKDVNTEAICYCSEGFAEKMFSTVIGVPVKATVISSLRKGDQTCIYRIEMP